MNTRFYGTVLILMALVASAGCSSKYKYPEECLRSEQIAPTYPVTAIHLYQVNRSSWMSESKAETEASKTMSLQGKQAADVWSVIERGRESRVQVNIEGLPNKSQNHVMYVTNSKGQKWSVKIMTVYKGAGEWHLTCRWAERVWIASVSPELASALGVSW